jgi:hypothetical protein
MLPGYSYQALGQTLTDNWRNDRLMITRRKLKWTDNYEEKTKNCVENPSPVPLCPLIISY